MASHNPLHLLHQRFERIRPDLEAVFQHDPESLKRIQETADKIERDAASGQLATIVFGHYNAGKSTFINALLGHEAAPMGDVPLTAGIGRYPWHGHILYDSPGIDAPIEHEEITDAFITKECNAVIYVIATGGSLEETATWERLCHFIRQKKAVLIVINDKHGHDLNGVEFARIRNTVYSNMQAAARRHGITDLLDRLDVLHVKARTALKARLEGKAALLELSGILEVEDSLRRFLDTSIEKIVDSDRERARALVSEAIEALSVRAKNPVGRDIARCRAEVEHEKRRVETNMIAEARSLAKREEAALHAVVSDMSGQTTAIQEALSQAFARSQDRLANGVEKHLRSELEKSQALVLRTKTLLKNSIALGQAETPEVSLDTPVTNAADTTSAGASDITSDILGKIRNMPIGTYTEDGVTLLLQQGKSWFPELFKGIGPKTMGKWAGTAGRVAGPLLVVLQSGYALYQAQREEAQERERFQHFVAGVMSKVRQALDDATEQYELMFKRITSAVFDPVLHALDQHSELLQTVEAGDLARRERLANWTRQLDT